ncbi:MAG TPA: GTPase HflX [Candidatus Anaerobutyricum stercoris]|mgnify:FL=1|uniref:GTPase HflX n=1 Tax=Candidatus Anaerobutyricum stercoris TaxID=2838457 RepID=A0A9D2ELS9_9FIRM|nr:GTPase HflX [Eubacterium sp. An3]OUO30244.1 GTPase HflX [Eubacterium sp. An3]CVI64897.1 GTPase HflX [Eubacteriaceae bacterium CHKCI004]HIZ39705.1 GTPase HflX [Candidatus Anaerobutyricum stercoris]
MDEKIKALLVGVNLNDDPDFENALKELESLAEACDMEVVGVETQNVSQINTGVYVGTGKVDEIKAVAHMLNADVVIFDNTLSPMQLRNLKDIIERPILDRTNLILQIFSSRAQTREAKIQVETARLQYELPRLTGMGEVLSRQGGTSGGMSNRGAGETKLELDKRKIRHRISELKKELKVVEKNRETQRKRRLIQGIPQVALVGYTNAGKSTLMNALLDKYEQKDEKKVLAEDMLFATLDTTIRSIHLPDKKEFLISDTVGFINKLPHNLVQAFHSTLEEVKYADLLLEIVDYSDENHKDQMKVTEDTLRELGAEQIPCIHVYNKCDGIIEPLPQIRGDDIYMAAKRGIGLEELVEMISSHIYQNYVDCVMLIPYTEGALVSYFSENATVKETEYLAEGTKLTMNCLLKDLKKYKQYVVI